MPFNIKSKGYQKPGGKRSAPLNNLVRGATRDMFLPPPPRATLLSIVNNLTLVTLLINNIISLSITIVFLINYAIARIFTPVQCHFNYVFRCCYDIENKDGRHTTECFLKGNIITILCIILRARGGGWTAFAVHSSLLSYTAMYTIAEWKFIII